MPLLSANLQGWGMLDEPAVPLGDAALLGGQVAPLDSGMIVEGVWAPLIPGMVDVKAAVRILLVRGVVGDRHCSTTRLYAAIESSVIHLVVLRFNTPYICCCHRRRCCCCRRLRVHHQWRRSHSSSSCT